MSISYFYLASKNVASSSASFQDRSDENNINSIAQRSSWNNQIDSLLGKDSNKKKLEELSSNCISNYDPLYSTLYLMAHYETLYWIQTNISEYKATQSFVIPKIFLLLRQQLQTPPSFSSWKREFYRYWMEVKERVMPYVVEHQLLVLILYTMKELIVPRITSKETSYKLTQHPLYTSQTIFAQPDKDRISSGMEMIAISLWSNGLFFVSAYIANRLLRLRSIYKIQTRRRAQQQRRLNNRSDDIEAPSNSCASMYRRFWMSSCKLFYETWNRWIYSSIGSGIGSMFFGPGWVAMTGLAIGDAYGSSAILSSSESFLSLLGALRSSNSHPFIASIFSGMQHLLLWSTRSGGDTDSNRNNNTISSSSNNNNNDRSASRRSSLSAKDVAIMKEEYIVCGCCQTTEFSSNPHNPKRVPVSSRVCDHTICKSCVEQCQIALMERTSAYEDWIKCPLCNEPNAFNCHTHLINRGLCSAIHVIENYEINNADNKNNDNFGSKETIQ